MKKKIIKLLFGLNAVLIAFSGCGSTGEEKKQITELFEWNTNMDVVSSEADTVPDISTENVESQESQNIQESQDSKENIEVDLHDLYIDFLSGKVLVDTSALFENETDSYKTERIQCKKYSYPELVMLAEDFTMSTTGITRYTFADLTRDGQDELIVRFDATDNSFMNWIGIICYENGNLELTDYYMDGYRTYSELKSDGYLMTGGSFGAGAYGDTYSKFDEKGQAQSLYSVNHYWSSFATSIAYDLSGTLPDFPDIYTMDEASELEVTEYIPHNGDSIKIVVHQYSSDEKIREIEENFIGQLVEMGAEVITAEELDRLCNQDVSSAEEVIWYDWEEKCTLVRSKNLDWVYPEPTEYQFIALDDDEYSMKILITVNKEIHDVKILNLFAEGYEDEKIVYKAYEATHFDKVTKQLPLVIQITLVGDLANYGLSYTDENEERHNMSINMSNFDSSIYLEPIEIKEG